MTRTNPDKITPEEWRTAAKVARRSIFTEGNPDLADAWDKAADQVEAEARVIPASGLALTAEEFADLHNMIWEGRGDYSSRDRLRKRFPQNHDCRMPHPQLATLFCTMLKGHEGTHFDSRRDVQWPTAPAEPAEEETKAEGPCMGGGDMHPCVLSAGHAGVHTDSRGLRWNYPASSPVVPAPTEASVIGGAAVALRSAMALLDPHEGGDWEHAWRTIGDLADCASRAYAAAPTETGPRYCSSCRLNVPPAPYCTNCGGDTIPRSPTETGPWPSLLAVPVTVQKVKDAKGYEWHRRGSTDGWRGCNGADAYTSNCRTGHRDSAPFVAAEEG